MKKKETKTKFSGLDKLLSPSEALERINSWMIVISSKIAHSFTIVEIKDLQDEAIAGIKAVLSRTEKCNLLPKNWEDQDWESLSMTIAKKNVENETEPFYLV